MTKRINLKLEKFIHENFAGSQIRFAEAASLSPGTVSNWMNGAKPHGRVLMRVCKALNVTPGDLFPDWESEAHSNPSVNSSEIDKLRGVVEYLKEEIEAKNPLRILAIVDRWLVAADNAGIGGSHAAVFRAAKQYIQEDIAKPESEAQSHPENIVKFFKVA